MYLPIGLFFFVFYALVFPLVIYRIIINYDNIKNKPQKSHIKFLNKLNLPLKKKEKLPTLNNIDISNQESNTSSPKNNNIKEY